RQLLAVGPDATTIEDLGEGGFDGHLAILAVLRLRGEHHKVVIVNLRPLKRAKLARTTPRFQHGDEEVLDVGVRDIKDAFGLTVAEATLARSRRLDRDQLRTLRRQERRPRGVFLANGPVE